MLARILSKTIFSVFAAGAVLSLVANEVFAGGHHSWGGGDCCCGSVPEIGSGAAAGALALLIGGAFILKDRFFGAKSEKSVE